MVCAISGGSSQYACTRGGTAWRASAWTLRTRLSSRGSRRRRSSFRLPCRRPRWRRMLGGGAVRRDNAQCGATPEGMKVLDKLLRDPHVAPEESHCPVRGNIESLGNIEGQDMILLLTPLQPTVSCEHQGYRRGARHGPELPIRSNPLTSKDCGEPPHEGVPQRYGPVCIQVPNARSLGITRMMASCHYSGTSAPRRMAG